MVPTGGSVPSVPSKRRKKTRKQETWLNNKVIRAIRKMKLVGLKQAFKPGLLWMERLTWIGVFVLCLGYTIYLTVSTVNEYSENPVLNTFNDDEPVYKIPFPGTTITGTMILKNNPVDHLQTLYRGSHFSGEREFEYQGLMWTERVIDILLFTMSHLCELVSSFASKTNTLDIENVETFDLKNNQELVEHMNVTLYDNKRDPDLLKTVLPFLKNKVLDCKSILAACVWEGDVKNCTDVFVPIQTDVGTGCSFNRIPDQILRKRRGLISFFHNHTYADTEITEWERFKADSTVSVDGIMDLVNISYPRVQHHAGKVTGLSFMLVFEEDQGSSCPIVDSYGYMIGIHSPFEEPRIMQTGITVPPNKEVFIKVKSELTIADKQIKAISIEKRKCYFQEENPLSNFNIYTISNCHQECLGQKIREACHCSLLTLSEGKNERLCGPMQVECVRRAKGILEKGGYEKLCRDPVCYSPCTEIKYDADVSYLPYHHRKFFDYSSFKGLRNDSVTSIVHVAHGSNSVPTRERKLQFGFSILFGVIGGTWGMTLEFSLCTIFNILAGLAVLCTPECVEKVEDDDNGNSFEETTQTHIQVDDENDNSQPNSVPHSLEIDVENPSNHIQASENASDEISTGLSDSTSDETTPDSDATELSWNEMGVLRNPTANKVEEDEEHNAAVNDVPGSVINDEQTEATTCPTQQSVDNIHESERYDIDDMLDELLQLTEPF